MIQLPPLLDKLDLNKLEAGRVHRLRLAMTHDGLGFPIFLPVLVAKGVGPGPVVGFTAAVHGNELNGVRIIQKLFRELSKDVKDLQGTVVGVPVVNVPGYVANRREFTEGQDLNRIMPGRATGTSTAQYAARFIESIVRHLDYLVDLHTASFGRVNSLYVRTDMSDPVTAKLALLQHPQIIVHNTGEDGTLRSAAAEMGIHAITVEVGDPLRFQRRLIRYSMVGVHNVLGHLKMLPLQEENLDQEPVICDRSYWIYTDRGGLLDVFPDVAERVKKGTVIARLTDIYGDVVREYICPEDGIVVGKSTNPISQSGARILHLGVQGHNVTEI